MDIETQPERPAQIRAETEIEVILQAQQWNAVLMAISKQPYELAAPLMNAIQQQCMAAAKSGVN